MTEEEFIEKGYEAKFCEDYRLAKHLFDQCLKKYPNNAEAMRESGMLCWRHKNRYQAKTMVEKSLELDDNFWGHLYLAIILNSLTDVSSEVQFIRAAKHAPKDLEHVVSRFYADFLAKNKRYIEAKEQAIFALPFYLNEPKDVSRLNYIIRHCDLNLLK